jgi:TetR/AcrR family transcriptional regulator, regulator of biofilm formation and stress response
VRDASVTRSQSEPVRQARGEARRLAALEAVLRVVARDGVRGLTHRAVAAEAGTSLRATTYYFASKEDLLTQAVTHYLDERIEHVRGLSRALQDAGALAIPEAAEVLADLVIDEITVGHDRLVAEYEFTIEATRTPALAVPLERFHREVVALLTALAVAAGSAEPEVDAPLLLAAVRGIELEALSRPEGREVEVVRRQCRRLVEALAAQPS